MKVVELRDFLVDGCEGGVHGGLLRFEGWNSGEVRGIGGMDLLGQSLGESGEESIFLGVGRNWWRGDIGTRCWERRIKGGCEEIFDGFGPRGLLLLQRLISCVGITLI